MHKIQSKSRNFKNYNLGELLDVAVTMWQVVVDNNTRDKHLVSKSDYDKWDNYREKTTVTLMNIVAEYYSGNDNLTGKNTDFLMKLINNIDDAKYVDTKKLLKNKAIKHYDSYSSERLEDGYIDNLTGKKISIKEVQKINDTKKKGFFKRLMNL